MQQAACAYGLLHGGFPTIPTLAFDTTRKWSTSEQALDFVTKNPESMASEQKACIVHVVSQKKEHAQLREPDPSPNRPLNLVEMNEGLVRKCLAPGL